MTLKREKALAIFLSAVFVMLAVGCGASKQGDEQAQQVLDQFSDSDSTQRQDKRENNQAQRVFDHIVENLRYCRYWFGTTGIDDVYIEGNQISALVFWTKTNHQSTVGFCSTDLSRCIATSGTSINPKITRMQIHHALTPKAAFESFVNSDFSGDELKLFLRIQPLQLKSPPTANTKPLTPTVPSDLPGDRFPAVERLNPNDFEFEEKSITLPPLGLPSSILHRMFPKEAPHEAKRIRQQFVCWDIDTKRSPGCTGTQVFAYYSKADPYWFLLRSCSSACPIAFQGDSIEFLTRREDGWAITVGGFMNSPKEEVARFKQKIEQAEMFRFKLP